MTQVLAVPYGTIEYDSDDRIVCHVCGLAFQLLPPHTRSAHGLSAADYRRAFGIGHQTSLGGREFNQKRSDRQLSRIAHDPEYRERLIAQGRALTEVDSATRKLRRASYDPRPEAVERNRARMKKWAKNSPWKLRGPERTHTDRVCPNCGVHFLPIVRERGRDGEWRWRVTKNKTCTPGCLSELRRRNHHARKIPASAHANILTRLSTGEASREIAREFGVSTETVNRIRRESAA
jgi:hypothetical protein